MAAKFFCIFLLALAAFQVECSPYKRDTGLPILNLADPQVSLQSFLNFTNNAISQLFHLGNQANANGTNAIQQIRAFAEATINKTKNDIDGLVATVTKKLENTALGHGIKGAQCLQKEVSSAVSVGKNGLKSVFACTTNQVNSFVTPAQDLISQGIKGLTIGVTVYQNVTSCFPAGLTNINIGNIGTLLQDINCVVGKIGPIATEINNIIQSLVNDTKNLQSSIANVRNSIVNCPRERRADIEVQLGNVVSDFGKCLDAINPDVLTAAPTTVSSTA